MGTFVFNGVTIGSYRPERFPLEKIARFLLASHKIAPRVESEAWGHHASPSTWTWPWTSGEFRTCLESGRFVASKSSPWPFAGSPCGRRRIFAPFTFIWAKSASGTLTSREEVESVLFTSSKTNLRRKLHVYIFRGGYPCPIFRLRRQTVCPHVAYYDDVWLRQNLPSTPRAKRDLELKLIFFVLWVTRIDREHK